MASQVKIQNEDTRCTPGTDLDCHTGYTCNSQHSSFSNFCNTLNQLYDGFFCLLLVVKELFISALQLPILWRSESERGDPIFAIFFPYY